MSKKAYAINSLQYREGAVLMTIPAGSVIPIVEKADQVEHVAGGKPFISPENYDELFALNAVRPANRVDAATVEDAGGSQAKAEHLPLAPEVPNPSGTASDAKPVDAVAEAFVKFRGAAKWSIMRGEAVLKDGIDTKAEAEGLLPEYNKPAATAEPEALLS